MNLAVASTEISKRRVSFIQTFGGVISINFKGGWYNFPLIKEPKDVEVNLYPNLKPYPNWE